MNPPHDRTPTVRCLIIGLLLLAVPGCAHLPWTRAKNPVSPGGVAADTLGQAAAAAPVDTLRRGPLGTRPILESESAPGRTTKPAPSEKPATPDAATADTLKADSPSLSVSVALTEKERQALQSACLGDLSVAEAIMSRVSSQPGGAKSQEKIETVRGFVTQSRAALEAGDVRAAATLAHKARVLAEDMASRAAQ